MCLRDLLDVKTAALQQSLKLKVWGSLRLKENSRVALSCERRVVRQKGSGRVI